MKIGNEVYQSYALKHPGFPLHDSVLLTSPSNHTVLSLSPPLPIMSSWALNTTNPLERGLSFVFMSGDAISGIQKLLNEIYLINEE